MSIYHVEFTYLEPRRGYVDFEYEDGEPDDHAVLDFIETQFPEAEDIMIVSVNIG